MNEETMRAEQVDVGEEFLKWSFNTTTFYEFACKITYKQYIVNDDRQCYLLNPLLKFITRDSVCHIGLSLHRLLWQKNDYYILSLYQNYTYWVWWFCSLPIHLFIISIKKKVLKRNE